jgi:hypothetical protein
MKILALFCFLLMLGPVQAQNGKLTLSFEWAGIEEGYDHVVKDEIYVDGLLVATTDEHIGSKPMNIDVKVSRGKHTIKTVNWTLYQGSWEQTRTDNDYSMDGFTEEEYSIGKKSKLHILYDLDNSATPIVEFK